MHLTFKRIFILFIIYLGLFLPFFDKFCLGSLGTDYSISDDILACAFRSMRNFLFTPFGSLVTAKISDENMLISANVTDQKVCQTDVWPKLQSVKHQLIIKLASYIMPISKSTNWSKISHK